MHVHGINNIHSIIICKHNKYCICKQRKHEEIMVALTTVQKQQYYTMLYIQRVIIKVLFMRTAVSVVLDTHWCDLQHWPSQMLCSQPAYCTTLIEQCVITMKGTVIRQFNLELDYSCGQNRQ